MKKYIVFSMLGLAAIIIGVVGSLESETKVAEASQHSTDHVDEYSDLFSLDYSIITNKETHDGVKNAVKEGKLLPDQVGANRSEIEPEEELTKDGFADSFFYTSNHQLYMALHEFSVLTEGNEYGVDTRNVLRHVEERLNDIVYTGTEKAEELTKVKELVRTAIENNAYKDDEIILEIHNLLADLDEYFNIPYVS